MAQQQLENEQKQNTAISNVGFQLGDQIKAGLANPIDGEAGTRQAAQDAYYNRQTSMLDPEYANRQRDLDVNLSNKGVIQGSTAYGRAQDQLAREKEYSYGQARDQAVSQGASSQAQALSNALQIRSAPYNELASIRSATPITNPTYQQTAQANAGETDVAGNIYKSYQAQAANSNNFMNGLFGLGSAAITKFSDRRLKQDIRRIGTTDGGTPIYTYRYIGDPATHMGVMADEVPHAAFLHPSGFQKVDYALVQ